MKSILLISHGSFSPKTVKEIKILVTSLKKKTLVPIVHFAFLEIASPSIPEGVDLCVEDGASEVIILLNFLNSGKHVDQDIPRIVKEAHLKYPNVKFSITKPVGQHSGIIGLFSDMIK